MFTADESGVYARVEASPARRFFAVGVLFALGTLVLYSALVQPPAAIWLLFMILLGGLALWLAEKLRRATLGTIELTDDEVRDTNGRVLARMDEIRGIERGTLAFKPSNGFTLVMNTKRPRAWAPGLWWRIGKRVGVGGVTSAAQAKFMAEQIAFRLSQRDG
ncbi:hypothetical protein [Yoonia sp.]|uniref:hypothetical protein n=1 Tax=Yoonia sp. TaxID=2212373 RepID=UPI003F6BE802